MSGGGGGGSSIIAAYAAVRALIRTGPPATVDDERAELDSEELREVEYESIGLPVPEHRPKSTGRLSFLRRLIRR
jgi:hypothetical protein